MNSTRGKCGSVLRCTPGSLGLGLLYLAFGACSYLWAQTGSLRHVGSGRHGSEPPGEGRQAEVPILFWVSDRGGNALIGLGPQLHHVRRVQVPAPLQLAVIPADEGSGSGADLWAVSATAGTPLGAHELLHLDGLGQLLWRRTFDPLVDLDRTRDGGRGVLALERVAGAGNVYRVWVAERDVGGQVAGARLLVESVGLSAVSGRAGQVVVGHWAGEVWLLDLRDGTVLAQSRPAASIADLAPGPAPRSWWMLESGGAGHLALLGPDLQPLWRVATSMAALHLIPVPGEERVWLADSNETLLRRYGPAGVLEIERDDLAMGGLDRGVARSVGGVLLTAAGALLAFDDQGEAIPGQGGFQFLIDVVAVARD